MDYSIAMRKLLAGDIRFARKHGASNAEAREFKLFCAAARFARAINEV